MPTSGTFHLEASVVIAENVALLRAMYGLLKCILM
jgi:hypothetical protein